MCVVWPTHFRLALKTARRVVSVFVSHSADTEDASEPEAVRMDDEETRSRYVHIYMYVRGR